MQAQIIHNGAAEEYFFEEGCYITELSNTLEDSELSIAKARVKPGETTRWHKLALSSERYLILSGVGVVEIGDLPPSTVNPGDVVIIPTQVPQRISNKGQVDLIFIALCTPRFNPYNYVDIEPG